MKKKWFKKMSFLMRFLKTKAKIIVMIGAGDIGELVDPLKEKLLKEIA